MIWGLLPIVLLSMNYDSQNIGIIAASIQQSGASVNYLQEECLIFIRKENAVLGMLLQGIAILFIPFAQEFYQLASISAVLGWEP
jgi:hypothetical protein